MNCVLKFLLILLGVIMAVWLYIFFKCLLKICTEVFAGGVI